MLAWCAIFALISILCYWIVFGNGADVLARIFDNLLGWIITDWCFWSKDWTTWLAVIGWLIALCVFAYGLINADFRMSYVG